MMTSKCSCKAVKQMLAEVTVEPVLLLYMLSTFSQYALFQDLVYTKVCWTNYGADVCDNLHSEEQTHKEEMESIQRLSSYWILMSTVCLVIPSILISIYLGSWSDRFGRKWPVVFPPLGGIMACLVYIVISFKPLSSVAWICLASGLSGLSGGFASCIMSCMSYVATVSSEDNRTVRISRLEAMTFIGGTIGPFISGFMLEVTGHGYAFFFMMVCYCLSFLYAVFVVRDLKDGSENEQQPNAVTTLPDILPTNVHNEQRRSLLPHPQCDPPVAHSDNEEEDDEEEELRLNEDDIPETNEIQGNDRVANKRAKNKIVSGPTDNGGLENNHSSRPSVGSNCSSRNTRNDDSGSGSGLEDERMIIRRGRESPLPGIPRPQNRRGAEDESTESWCSTYFGARHFLDAVKTVLKKREDNKRFYLLLVIAASYIAMMITAGELDVAYLFARGSPLNWTYQKYSIYFGMKYGIGACGLLIGMPLLQKVHLSDSTICIMGMVSRMAGLALYGLSFNSYMAYAVPLVSIFSFFTIPAARALLSKLVGPTEQGKMFAFVAIMEDLCTMSASILFNSLYPLTRPILHGFIFLLAAALLVIPIAILWYVGNRLSAILLYDPQGSDSSSSLQPSMEGGGAGADVLRSV